MHRFGSEKWFWYYLWKRRFNVSLRHQPPSTDTSHGDPQDPKAKSYIDNVDPVPPAIVAGLKVTQLFKAAPECFKPMIRLALSLNEGGVKDIPHRSLEEEAHLLAKKGTPRDTVFGPAAALLEALAQDAPGGKSLFTTDPQVESAIVSKKNVDWTPNNCFVVDKSTVNPKTNEMHKRVIIDARRANAKLQNLAEMELFALELLIERMAYAFKKSLDQRVHCCSADLRHWFHQIPLPCHLRRHFALRIMTRRGPRYLFPRAWPMGVHSAPGIGQACTWSVLLSNLEAKKEETEIARQEREVLRKHLGISDSQSWDAVPTWLPLTCGGAVFVLIDNIFVVSPDEEVAKAWRSRIADCCNRYHAQLKRAPDAAGTADYARQNTRDDVEFVTLVKNDPSSSIAFSGISFSGAGRRVASPPVEANPIPVSGSWSVPFRKLASLMGLLLWCERVHGTPMLALEDFLQIYRHAIPPDNNSWNKDTLVPPELTAVLRNLYNKHRSAPDDGKSPLVAPYPAIIDIAEADVYLGASDAEGGEKKGMGFVFKKRDEENAKWYAFDRSEIESHDFDKIALGELKAVVALVKKLFETYKDDRPKLLMIAVDNMSAIGMIAKAYSKVPEARSLLRELFKLLDDNQAKLFVSHIMSERNPADNPSRGAAVKYKQLLELEGKFIKWEPLARKSLLMSGKNRVVRRDREVEDFEKEDKQVSQD